jgi:hypothetical protein
MTDSSKKDGVTHRRGVTMIALKGLLFQLTANGFSANHDVKL